MNWPMSIRRYRKLEAVKQEALAEMIGVDQAAVSRWERGIDAPNLHAQKKLRDLFLTHGDSDSDQRMFDMIRRSPFHMAAFVGNTAFCAAISAGSLETTGMSRSAIEGRDLRDVFDSTTIGDLIVELENLRFGSGSVAAIESIVSFTKARNGIVETYHVHSLQTPYFAEDGRVYRISNGRAVDEQAAKKLVDQFGGQISISLFEDMID